MRKGEFSKIMNEQEIKKNNKCRWIERTVKMMNVMGVSFALWTAIALTASSNHIQVTPQTTIKILTYVFLTIFVAKGIECSFKANIGLGLIDLLVTTLFDAIGMIITYFVISIYLSTHSIILIGSIVLAFLVVKILLLKVARNSIHLNPEGSARCVNKN